MENIGFFLPIIVVLGAFLFFGARRQRKAMEATIELHESLRVGDRVLTTSGLQARIVAITDDTVDLEIAPGVLTTWVKLAIRDRVEPEADGGADLEAGAEPAAEASTTRAGAEQLPSD